MNQFAEIVPHLPWIVGAALGLGAMTTLGWIHTTRLKIKHGYPLEGMWGQSLKPSTDGQTAERVKLLTQENAELRAELKKKGDYLALAQLPRNASPVRLSNRCRVSGRKRAFIREFQMSRLTFRELACAGLIPGVTKASW